MPLSPGDKLGHYRIQSMIGKGGMGEVYQALDTKLDRDVAIKVLPAAFASDRERLARFEREAKLLASLNHPGIASIYGVEDHALVMELVPGPTLADRIQQGPIPAAEAEELLLQLADALEYAHDKGVIHRDLKPANIKIDADDKAKILDFGLAKAFADPLGANSDDPANSPTLTMGATIAGTILGTAAYMAPEQARGKKVDKRADIWAFGVVAWEMLTGERLFHGETTVEVLGKVLEGKFDFERVPERFRRLVTRCLDRNVRDRLRDIGEVRFLLHEPPSQPASTVALAPPARFAWMPWAAAGVLAVIAATAGFGYYRASQPAPLKPLTRFSVDLGPDAVRGPRLTVAISPDGQRIAFVGRGPNGARQLFTRRLDQPEAIALTGTVSSSSATHFQPFFSPDGQWIGFFSEAKLKKVAVEGGSPITLGSIPSTTLGGSWGEDGNIYFGTTTGVRSIPEAGGNPLAVKGGDTIQFFPQALPGGQVLLASGAGAAPSSLESSTIDAIQLTTGERKTLLRGGYSPSYLPTPGGPGRLVYMHEGTLFAVGFDPQKLELLGTPAPLLQDIASSSDITVGGGQFSFSRSGTFVYLSGKSEDNKFSVQWLDAAGKTTALIAQPGAYNTPRFSPDGKRLAYIDGGGNVWVYDLERQTPTQLTFTAPGVREVAWALDSKHLVFGDTSTLWWIRADGSGQPQKLVEKQSVPRPFSFAPDGRLVFTNTNGTSLPEIWTLPVDVSDPEHPKAGKAESFLVVPGVVQVDPAFSPDGKFLAYASSESGPNEIFVRPFPGPGGKWKVSTEGGKFPVWSRATHELLFLGSDDHIMAADYSIQGDSFNAGKPRVWSPTPVRRMGVQQNFDLAPDGKRVVMFPRPVAEEGPGSLHATFLLNFFDEVRRRVP